MFTLCNKTIDAVLGVTDNEASGIDSLTTHKEDNEGRLFARGWFSKKSKKTSVLYITLVNVIESRQ